MNAPYVTPGRRTGTQNYVAVNRRILAVLCSQHQRFDEAEPLLQQLLAISEVAFGADHVNTVQVLEDLATLQIGRASCRERV